MGPNPHEQRGLEASRQERVQRLDNPSGRQISSRSRRIGVLIAAAVVLALVALIVLGWLNLEALRPQP